MALLTCLKMTTCGSETLNSEKTSAVFVMANGMSSVLSANSKNKLSAASSTASSYRYTKVTKTLELSQSVFKNSFNTTKLKHETVITLLQLTNNVMASEYKENCHNRRAPWKNRICSTTMILRKSPLKPVTWQKTCNYIELFGSSARDHYARRRI